MTLVTKAVNSPTLSINIQWDIHDDSANMEDIEFHYDINHEEYTSYFPKREQSGTILILEHLRDKTRQSITSHSQKCTYIGKSVF